MAAGKLLRAKIRFIQRLYVPSSVIAGILGLIIVQVSCEYLSPGWTAGWSRLPGFLINIVFAALFMGVAIPPLSGIWKKAGPQLAYGQIVAWGQYVVGVGLVIVLLGPVFGVPDMFGVIIPVGFEGGHGTAGGLADTFVELGWEDGKEFGLASATVGLVSAILVGMVLLNWAARKKYVTGAKTPGEMSGDELAGIYPESARPEAGRLTVSPDSIDALALQLSLIGVAVLIGYGIKTALLGVEGAIPFLREKSILKGFPHFPLCMIGGLIVQLAARKAGADRVIDRGLMQRISGTALDFLVVAAISTIRIEAIKQGLIPFAIIVAGGIAWNVFCVVWLARRMLPDYWFERSIAELGQSMGVTATGLLLLRAADPENKTSASAAFGYKQLLHEPFMGGGLWTSSAVLIVARSGGITVLVISVLAIAIWLIVWRLLWGGCGCRKSHPGREVSG